MNLTRLQYFIEVARCGSFSTAAERLYTSQPNLSKQIAAMERETGLQLFNRTTRSVTLTTAGQYLFDQLQTVPTQIESALRQAARLSRTDQRHICIGVLEGQEVNPRLRESLAEITHRYPDLHVELERNSFANLRSGLTNLHYDLIVTLEFEVDPAPEYRRAVFLHQPAAIAIHSNNPKSCRPELTLEELADEEFVVISPEESQRGFQRFIRQCEAAGFMPRIARQPRSLESVLLCVEAGIGVALLDPNVRLESHDVVRIVPLPGSRNDVIIVGLSAHMTPELAAIMEMLSEPEEETA
jgi:DNA-binding transcriptional LysR family regulator